jgi:hypothetical protein
VNAPAVGYARGMGVVNRRNALLGWVVWTTTKRVAKQKAKSAGRSDGESRAPNKRAVAAGIAAVGGALWFLKRRSGPDEET